MSNSGIINTGGAQAIDELRDLQRHLSDTTPLFREIAQILERNAKRRFQTKMDPDGKRWPKWAPTTAKRRAKKGLTPASNLLLVSGKLRDSIQAKSGRSFAWAESSSPYAQFHEQASGAGDRRLPRRAFLLGANGSLGKTDQREIDRAVERYFETLLT